MNNEIIKSTSLELNIKANQVEAVLKMLEEGNVTTAYIAKITGL